MQAGVETYFDGFPRGPYQASECRDGFRLGEWGLGRHGNLDNGTLHLSFEVDCLVYSTPAVAELKSAFRSESILLDQRVRNVEAPCWFTREEEVC
jgi:hypothetical protein